MSKILLFIFLSGIAMASVVYIPGREKQSQVDYLSAIKSKHSRIQSLSGSRLILAGGSSMAFGIDSKLLEEEVGVPTVNLSLHAGLGLEFVLEEVKSVTRRGDEVILSFAYLYTPAQSQLLNEVRLIYPPAEKYVYTSLVNSIYAGLLHDFRSNMNSLFKPEKNSNIDALYSAKNFNKYGDFVGYLNHPNRRPLGDKGKLPQNGFLPIGKLNLFYEAMKKKGVEVRFLFPAYAESQYIKNEKAIQNFYQECQEELKLPMLNAPKGSMYPDSLFFDSVYHLNSKGKELRTKDVINLLQESS